MAVPERRVYEAIGEGKDPVYAVLKDLDPQGVPTELISRFSPGSFYLWLHQHLSNGDSMILALQYGIIDSDREVTMETQGILEARTEEILARMRDNSFLMRKLFKY